MWKIFALLSALCAAMTAITAKIGVRDIDSNLATAIRTTVVLLLTWGIVLFTGAQSTLKAIPKSSWIFLIVSGVFTGLSWLFYFKAIQIGDVSKVAPIDKLSVVFVVIIAAIFLREPVNLKVLAGVGLITAGSLLLLWK